MLREPSDRDPLPPHWRYLAGAAVALVLAGIAIGVVAVVVG